MTMKTSMWIAAAFLLVLAGRAHAADAARERGDADPDRRHTEAEPASGRADEGSKRVVQGRNDIEGEIIGTPAKGSPFAKLEIGMTQDEASDLLGSAKQCGAYRTGKEWIPFRFSSSDVLRTECNYKGLGRLIYTQGKRGAFLLKIVNDASESGIRD